MSALLEMGEDPCKEDEVRMNFDNITSHFNLYLQVGRGCLEAAILYCNIHVVKLILKAYLSKEGTVTAAIVT